MIEPHYTPQEAAGYLGTDDEQVTAWIHAGELVAVNVAKNPNGKRPRWRIPESALGRFLLARRHPASSQAAPGKRPSRPQVKQYV